jgi:hypothetical protein
MDIKQGETKFVMPKAIVFPGVFRDPSLVPPWRSKARYVEVARGGKPTEGLRDHFGHQRSSRFPNGTYPAQQRTSKRFLLLVTTRVFGSNRWQWSSEMVFRDDGEDFEICPRTRKKTWRGGWISFV